MDVGYVLEVGYVLDVERACHMTACNSVEADQQQQ